MPPAEQAPPMGCGRGSSSHLAVGHVSDYGFHMWVQGEACMLSKISLDLHTRWGGQGTGGRALWVWLQVLRGVLKITRRGS